MSTLARAIAIAALAHQAQFDRAGAPYILHPLRVMFQVGAEYASDRDLEAAQIVAVLHDVVEDTDWTPEGLRAEGFSEEVLAALDGVTARQGEAYDAFIERARANPIARIVKLADLQDNMDTRRLPVLTDRDLERVRKYHRYYQQLKHLVLEQAPNI